MQMEFGMWRMSFGGDIYIVVKSMDKKQLGRDDEQAAAFESEIYW